MLCVNRLIGFDKDNVMDIENWPYKFGPLGSAEVPDLKIGRISDCRPFFDYVIYINLL